jgi:preprotein translocase subunit SecB
MAANLPTSAAPAADPNAPELQLQNIYIKDASFEAPNGPNLPAAEWSPQFGMNMAAAGTTVAENIHEVVLTITLEAKVGERVAYLVEVKQAGMFTLRNYSVDDARRIIGGFCPGVLFPYARQAVADLIMRGGFPPFLLPPVNFDALFQQSLEQAAAQQQPAPAQSTVN